VLIRKLLSLALALSSFLAPRACDRPHKFFLPAQGFVNDFSNVLDAETRANLTALSEELDQKTHAELVVLTVDSLGGMPIEKYATAIFNEWGIGHKDDNRGVLILLAKSDRQWRIEVGRGLEVLLPNAKAGEIGAKMVPELQQGRYSSAVLQAANDFAGILARDRAVSLTPGLQAAER